MPACALPCRFDFVRRRLSVVLDYEGQALLVCKGAMEETLALCTWVQDGEAVLPMEDRWAGVWGSWVGGVKRGGWVGGLGE